MSTITVPAPTASRRLAAATPARRDRYVDFLRVASLAAVMLGHWLMAAVEWDDGRLRASNVLEVAPAMQWLTWAFQIMPVFFLVGGFSNTASWTAARRDGKGCGAWLGSRLTRLVRPVLAFALVWTAVAVAVRLGGGDPAALRAGSIAQPLWFLAVYVAVVAVAPAMVRAHGRWGLAVPVVLAASVAAVDLARWPFGVPLVGWANLALVWLFAHQLGVAWRSGSVSSWSRRRLAVVAGSALLVVVALTSTGGYPRSMVGGMEARSNTFPPSLALVTLFARVELARVEPRPQPSLRTAAAAVAVIAGMGVLAKRGFLSPGAGLGLVATGCGCCGAGAGRGRSRRRPDRRRGRRPGRP